MTHTPSPLLQNRAERDNLKVNLKASESEKAELASALEQAKHTVRGWGVGLRLCPKAKAAAAEI